MRVRLAVRRHRNANGIAQSISLFIVLQKMNVSQMLMIVAVIVVRKCVDVGNVSQEMLPVQRAVLHNVIMTESAPIMKAVTVVIVRMVMLMIVIIVNQKMVSDVHETILIYHARQRLAVLQVSAGIVRPIVVRVSVVHMYPASSRQVSIHPILCAMQNQVQHIFDIR